LTTLTNLPDWCISHNTSCCAHQLPLPETAVGTPPTSLGTSKHWGRGRSVSTQHAIAESLQVVLISRC
jgi:hypothetical protein